MTAKRTGNMTASTRDRVIHTAHDMFYEMGFHAVGLGAILKKVGITKTSFYNHFESRCSTRATSDGSERCR